MKKVLSFLLLILMLYIPLTAKADTTPSPPEISGKAAVLMDIKTGKVLYEKNPHERLYPASITKVMTAIIALENAKLDDIITTGSNPPRVEGTRIYLEEGETLTLKQLLYAMMLRSANDAAIAVAEHISGSVPAFALLMNEKARELGCTDTNFTNPHGLTDENHYTSAYDMAVITRYALKNPEFARIIRTKSYEIPWKSNEPDRLLINANKLLWRYAGADGVKTGYTTAAGQTITASATRDGRQLLAVVLKTQGTAVWDDPVKLLDYGFANFRLENMVNGAQVFTTVDVKYGKPLDLVTESGFSYVLPANSQESIKQNVVINNDITAPILKGQQLGKIEYVYNGKTIGEVNLQAKYAVPRSIYTRWWFWAASIYVPFRTWVAVKRWKRSRERYKYNTYISLQRWDR